MAARKGWYRIEEQTSNEGLYGITKVGRKRRGRRVEVKLRRDVWGAQRRWVVDVKGMGDGRGRESRESEMGGVAAQAVAADLGRGRGMSGNNSGRSKCHDYTIGTPRRKTDS